MSITMEQGIVLSIMVFFMGIDFWLESLFTFRPIIVCTITGIILGDVHLGLVTGGLTELAFAGLTPAGGTQPPNPILAGVMTTVIAYTTRVDAQTAIGLALPFSFLMQYIILFYYSTFSFFMTKADKYAKEADISSFVKINILTTFIVAITYSIVVFLSTYVAQQPVQMLVTAMPQWLTHGFEIAGGILPGVGFGMLLKVMLQKRHTPYLLIGFLFATFIPFSNLLPIALLGTAFAMYEYYNQKKQIKLVKQIVSTSIGGSENEGI